MKYLYILVLVVSFSNLYSQDIILKKNGETIKSKIDEIGIEEIKYHKYSNLSGPIFIILKKDVSKITFENGDIEVYNIKSKTELKEIKNKIIVNINKYGYQHRHGQYPYMASFVGDYLRLQLMNKNTLKDISDDMVLDFSKVYNFNGVSKRINGVAYVNIWINLSTHKYNKIWKKYKLVIRVDGHKNAEVIMEALKEYNKLLNI